MSWHVHVRNMLLPCWLHSLKCALRIIWDELYKTCYYIDVHDPWYVHIRNKLLPCTFHSLKMSTENNMRRRSPRLLCEVLKSKNVVCIPICLFCLFSFFYDNVIAIRFILSHFAICYLFYYHFCAVNHFNLRSSTIAQIFLPHISTCPSVISHFTWRRLVWPAEI